MFYRDGRGGKAAGSAFESYRKPLNNNESKPEGNVLSLHGR